MSQPWELITTDMMTLRDYSCGVSAGQRLRMRRDLEIRTWDGSPTGKTIPAGSVSTVLAGNLREPEVVWLRRDTGEQHTWDTQTLLRWFEPIAS